MPAPFGGWSPLWRDDAAQREMQQDNSGAEFTTPPGYRDPDQYRGTAASQSLPHALPEGNPNG
ncbi:hypothetical protein ACJH6H_29350 [Mycobacterium sp. SMC-21]|uniref:hypothetical protein n=1 Tax=Mycobacterium sp. SMC-21 TaxID=3381632 RepID=UPI00387721FE